MNDSYRFVYKQGTGELVEKKSRFIAVVAPAASEEEACAFIEKTRKSYWDARHNCSAFTVGGNHRLTRSSDDGEPSGTAGIPMLNVLLGEDIHDAVAVVTRYFGGVLLGTGGLVRAYTEAVRRALADAVILNRLEGIRLNITLSYPDYGRIQHLAAENNIPVLESSFTDTVHLCLLVRSDACDGFAAAVTDSTRGRAVVEKGSPCLFTMHNSKVILL